MQDKIDKIGGFRFTIKGWTVAVIGIAATTASARVEDPVSAAFISIMLGMLVYMFFRLEVQQVRYSLKFGSRAIALEQEIDRIDQTATEVRRPSRQVPYIAQELALKPKRVRRKREASAKEQVWRRAHPGFYAVLLVCAGLPLITFVAKIRTKTISSPVPASSSGPLQKGTR